MVSILLAASLTFSATATGVEKGTPIEFLFAGKDSDRDYETMFILDEPVETLCARLEKAGMPKGSAVSVRDCNLWPVGCRVAFAPAMDEFVETKWPEGVEPSELVYTGGTRNEKGALDANEVQPLAFCALYTIGQAPILHNALYHQGVVYGAHTAKVTLEKGTKKTFTLTWDENTFPQRLAVTFAPGGASEQIRKIREVAAKGDVEVLADLDPSLTVGEAQRVAKALAVVDSVHVKINGRKPGRLFYRAFLPQDDWRDRQKRMAQPFELTIGAATNSFVFIEEDWTVEGDDPKLTPKEIPYADAAKHERTDTCFIFAGRETKLERLMAAMAELKGSRILNWYVFDKEQP